MRTILDKQHMTWVSKNNLTHKLFYIFMLGLVIINSL